MLVSEFLKLVPGPTALLGALISRQLVASDPFPTYTRFRAYELLGLRERGDYANWDVVEASPLYQNPSARYCAWCKASLYTGYSVSEGLTPGWCPTHGKDAKVLHAPDSAVESVILSNPLTADEEFFLVDQVPANGKPPRVKYQSALQDQSEDLKYFQDSLMRALKDPKALFGPMLLEKAAEEAGITTTTGWGASEFHKRAGSTP